MITEDYVSFEVAKLLKEKGFNEKCEKIYYKFYKKRHLADVDFDSIAKHFCKEPVIPVPTLQMAMKWLREIYGIDIVIEISDPSVKDRKYYCMIWDGNNNSYILDLFNSYEDAVEAALKYSLEKLI